MLGSNFVPGYVGANPEVKNYSGFAEMLMRARSGPVTCTTFAYIYGTNVRREAATPP